MFASTSRARTSGTMATAGASPPWPAQRGQLVRQYAIAEALTLTREPTPRVAGAIALFDRNVPDRSAKASTCAECWITFARLSADQDKTKALAALRRAVALAPPRCDRSRGTAAAERVSG